MYKHTLNRKEDTQSLSHMYNKLNNRYHNRNNRVCVTLYNATSADLNSQFVIYTLTAKSISFTSCIL